MDLLARVRHFIAQNRLFDSPTRVVAAVSGGSDSVALVHVIRDLSARGDCQVAGIAHFNHQLRETADRDEQFTVALAESLGWPITVGREDVAARARSERRSIEDAAHRSRHAFFEQARQKLGGDLVALGHTRDDQAETFLLRLLRGAGPKGLAAMYPRHGAIVRPLLSCRRSELRAYLSSLGVGYVDDESNTDLSVPRNRIRAELLPLLERGFNPAVVDVLADEAVVEREIWQWMDETTSDPALRTSTFEISDLRLLPAPLRRLVLWRAMRDHSGGRHVAFHHVEAALELLGSEGPRSADAPGHRLERLGHRLVLTRGTVGRNRPTAIGETSFDFPLSIPGEVPLPSGRVLAAEAQDRAVDLRTLGGNAAVVQRDRCIGQLRVRNRRPGDRFRPLGLAGQKKLQDYFVDRKVARHERDTIPIVVDETDKIVWVAGFGIDQAFRVTDPAQAVVILRLKLLGGSR